MSDHITNIITEIPLTEIIADWFAANQYGDIWAGGHATPDTWALCAADGQQLDADDYVVRFATRRKR